MVPARYSETKPNPEIAVSNRNSETGKERNLIELIRRLLRLRAVRTRRVAEYDAAMRKRSFEEMGRLFGERAAKALSADEILEDPELELRAIARSIAPLPPVIRLKLVEALPGSVREQVRSRIFAFEDILHLRSIGVQKLLSRLDTPTTALALVHADKRVVQAVFRNLSRRAAELFREEIEYRAQADAEDIRNARARIARTIMDLCDAGEIDFSPTNLVSES
jgi:hypothetical protein